MVEKGWVDLLAGGKGEICPDWVLPRLCAAIREGKSVGFFGRRYDDGVGLPSAVYPRVVEYRDVGDRWFVDYLHRSPVPELKAFVDVRKAMGRWCVGYGWGSIISIWVCDDVSILKRLKVISWG